MGWGEIQVSTPEATKLAHKLSSVIKEITGIYQDKFGFRIVVEDISLKKVDEIATLFNHEGYTTSFKTYSQG